LPHEGAFCSKTNQLGVFDLQRSKPGVVPQSHDEGHGIFAVAQSKVVCTKVMAPRVLQPLKQILQGEQTQKDQTESDDWQVNIPLKERRQPLGCCHE
jgi:hypothetical protein